MSVVCLDPNHGDQKMIMNGFVLPRNPSFPTDSLPSGSTSQVPKKKFHKGFALPHNPPFPTDSLPSGSTSQGPKKKFHKGVVLSGLKNAFTKCFGTIPKTDHPQAQTEKTFSHKIKENPVPLPRPLSAIPSAGELKLPEKSEHPIAYASIDKGLKELKAICRKKLEGSMPGEICFTEKTIPSLNDLQALYDHFIAAENQQTQNNIDISQNWISKIGTREYLFFPNLIIADCGTSERKGDCGTKEKIICGIDLKTGECISASISQPKRADERQGYFLSEEIFKKLVKLSAKDNQGGILPLQGMLYVSSSKAEEADLMRQIIITKFCPHGTLYDLLNSGIPLTPEQKHKIAKDLFQALLSLHEAGLVHGDLRLENVLLDAFKAFIADFDLTAFGSPKRPACLPFLPPEVILSGDCDMNRYNAQSEVWVLGLILYSLFSGQPPYIVRKLDENGADHPYDLADISLLLPWNLIEDKDETRVSKFLSRMMCEFTDRRISLKDAFNEFMKIPPEELNFIPPPDEAYE